MHGTFQYQVSPIPGRYLLPKIILLVVLGILLYIGIIFNYQARNAPLPAMMEEIFIGGIILLLALDAILSYLKYHTYYYFFSEEHITLHEKRTHTIPYHQITSFECKRSYIDLLFHTLTIKIHTHHKTYAIRHVRDFSQIYLLLQRKVE